MKLFARVKNQIKNDQKNLIFFNLGSSFLLINTIIIWPWLFSDSWQLALAQSASHLLLILALMFGLVVIRHYLISLVKILLVSRSVKQKNQAKFGSWLQTSDLFFICLAYFWPSNLVYLYRWSTLLTKFTKLAYWQTLIYLSLAWLMLSVLWQLKIFLFNQREKLEWQVISLKLQKMIKWPRFKSFFWGQNLQAIIKWAKSHAGELIFYLLLFFLAKTNFDIHLSWQNPVQRWQAISLALEDDWQAWKNYALALEEQGQTLSAINVYLKIYQHQLGNAELLTKIGDLFASQGNFITADYYYLKAQRLKTYDQEIIKRREHLRVLIP